MPRKKVVLVRTENPDFARRVKETLEGREAIVRITPDLNEVGTVLIGKPPEKLPQTFLEVQKAAWSYFLGLDMVRTIEKLFEQKYDFVIFDPFIAKPQNIEERFLDNRSHELRRHFCTLDDFQFFENGKLAVPLGWERNYFADKWYLKAERAAKIPNEYLQGLLFLTELKEAGRPLWNGCHPYFPFVLASDNPEMRYHAERMQSWGFLDYLDSELKFETVEWDFEPNRQQRAALDSIKIYLSGRARTAITASVLAAAPVILPNPAAAQNVTVYSRAASLKNIDYSMIVKDEKITAGFDLKYLENGTFALRLDTSHGPLVFFLDEEGKAEGKFICPKGKFNLVIGAGSDDLYYGGVLWNKLKPYGAGLSYKTNKNGTELRGSGWIYRDGVFVFARKANGNLDLLVAHPSENHGLGIEYKRTYGLKSGTDRQQIVFGTDGSPGFQFNSEFFSMLDGQIFGPASFTGRSPFRFIFTPFSWRLKGLGAQYATTTDWKGRARNRVHELGAAGYFTKNNFIQINGALGDGRNEYRIDIGRNTQNVAYTIGIGYDAAKRAPIALLELKINLNH
jgi:hypothetical protein